MGNSNNINSNAEQQARSQKEAREQENVLKNIRIKQQKEAEEKEVKRQAQMELDPNYYIPKTAHLLLENLLTSLDSDEITESQIEQIKLLNKENCLFPISFPN